MTEPTVGTRSAGALLRAAREKQGLHIAALAAAIKVSQRKLEALEADRLDELPDATFTRALAQTVCRQLKVDARPVLDLLPPASAVVLDTRGGSLNAPFRERPGRGDDPASSGIALRPLVLGAVVLVVAAGAVYLLPPGLFTRALQTSPTVAQPVPPPAVETPASAAVELPPPTVAVAPEPPASAALPATVEPAASAPVVVSAAPATTAPAAAPPAATPPAAAASGLVQLRSSEASWVEARDARGQVLLFRTVQAGESVGLDGALPIRLTIGNAAATQVALRGKPVDLAPRTRDNVARVELQ